MGEKRRFGNWDRGRYDDGGRWPSKSYRRWEQQNHAGFSTWREDEGSSKLESNGWGDRNPSFPSWFRTFCTSVCRIPWRKVCDAGRMMPIFKNVAEWNDSASQEAFQNAKARYLAKINRLPCDLPLPDPNMYIDKVNFDAVIDPELAADLERCFVYPDSDDKIMFDHSDAGAHEPAPTTGWGNAEHSVNWDKYIGRPTSLWDDEVAQPDPWARRRNQSIDVTGKDDGFWKHGVSQKHQEGSWRHQGSWKNTTQDRRNPGWHNMNSRYEKADDQMNRSWKNSTPFLKQVQAQSTWHRNGVFGSENHHQTGYSGSPWRWENAVS